MSPISLTLPNSNNTSTSTPQKDASPPTEPPETDLDSIGRHCALPYCNVLDFLPFRCSSCKATFCLDHRSETAHKCPRAGEWARVQQQQNRSSSPHSTSTSGSGSGSGATEKPTIYNSEQCAELSCKTLIHTLTDPGVRCPECRRSYCLRHRLREGHECRPVNARNNSAAAGGAAGGAETLKSMFAKVRTWGKEKSTALSSTTSTSTSTSGSKKPASRLATVNAMKKTAKGDPGTPPDRRIYLSVVGTSETNMADPPRGEFWFDGRWKVGRVLDDAARRLQVENVNNRGGGEEARLRVFHVESGEFLGFGDAVGERVKSGDTVVLLRGAGVIL
ncbi:hypothetical protein BO70DRAFT_366918 [Aspergillus heteromorphus CBS 117.55]|uniref:AN1-type domain-containing protein n=1 Tax=Aspergillus heteromorphus CBS 117.55 TaxID=1448321 RepID=A0A317UTS7_9EURO|nr:uncharacterized protein BO70DRAFT_366918 [Aspergillus heteromorphus CBS 117.55]PWY64769.1 hypothetical protein BO70DRAFT_366918 [Aspergillus heteromorphus CBS 117.55]